MQTYRGELLPLRDNESVEVPLPFTFEFQGTSWSSVFVNGNGNLTFGAPSGDFTETVPEFLTGPPRIAPLWDDLFAGNGLVIAEENNRELRIHFVGVPEFIATGTNYFTVILNQAGRITLKYGPTNRSDALVGITQGNGAADPGPVDLSDSRRWSSTGTTYERFLGSFTTWIGVDLSFKALVFGGGFEPD